MRPAEFYDRLAVLAREGAPFVVATVTGTSGSSPRKVGAKMLILQDGTTVDTVGGGVLEKEVIGDALRALRDGTSGERRYELRRQAEHGLDALCGGEATVFLDVYGRQRTLLIAGAGHVGTALATFAKLLDYRVVVVDPRQEMVAEKRLPMADDAICGDPSMLPELVPIDESVRVVVVTHDHRHDGEALRAVVGSPAAYVGMMGSAAKIKTIFGQLLDDGVDPAALGRVHAPIGIDIGAQTPAELALSIMAEIVAGDYGRGTPPPEPAPAAPETQAVRSGEDRTHREPQAAGDASRPPRRGGRR